MNIEGKTLVFKAQWPLSTNEEVPQILIYPFETRKPWLYLEATKDLKEKMFFNKYKRVIFVGKIMNGIVHIDKFVRQNEWV